MDKMVLVKILYVTAQLKEGNKMKKVLPFIIAIIFLLPLCSLATTIRVPGDQSNIQAGIDAAVDGDVVLLADGIILGVATTISISMATQLPLL